MVAVGETESDAPDAVVCLVTAPRAHGHPIATAMIDEGLAACVNVVPSVDSVYRWEGKVERSEESLLVVKTTRAAVRRIDELLRAVHPYDTFELVVLDVLGGSHPYLAWIAESVGNTSPTRTR
ncbi:MAG TPA: divalent-cation tolerance protein CutA [Solirubrobacteraceae bacterium]|jgi:periplasmic divalent cation tolerance protein